MDYEQIIKDIILDFVDDKEVVKVTSSREHNSIVVFVNASSSDTGRLIGHGGRVANAIREVANVAAKIEGIRLNVKFEKTK